MKKFTVVMDESGSPYFPARKGDEYFSVGLLTPQSPEELRDKIIEARLECSDERVKRRGFFHASQDGRDAHRFLLDQLQGVGFHFKMLFADKRAAEKFHKINKPRAFHRILVRETIKYGIADLCRKVDMLVGLQSQTLKSPQIIRDILEYHDTLQILDALRFPYGSTVRTRVENIRMVTPVEEPLMDVVDYLMWAHQRDELKDDDHAYLQLRATMSRTTVGGAHRFPGIARIFTCSTWLPDDPVFAGKWLPYIEASQESYVLPKILTALQLCIERCQKNPMLAVAYGLGSQIFRGNTEISALLEFGEALFEVLDTEGILLKVTEEEFCILKQGAAVCCWLRRKKMHKPPVDGCEKMLETFLSQITGKLACIS